MTIVDCKEFKDKLLTGSKTHTIQPVKENPKSDWNRLYEKFIRGPNCDKCRLEKNCHRTQRNYRCRQVINLRIWWHYKSRKMICDRCGQIYPANTTLIYCTQQDCIETMNDPKEYKNTPKIVNQREFLFNAILINMTKKKLGDLTDDEWRRTGFDPLPFNINSMVSSHISTRKLGLQWFAQKYDLQCLKDPHFMPVADDDRPEIFHPDLLNLEVYILEFLRIAGD